MKQDHIIRLNMGMIVFGIYWIGVYFGWFAMPDPKHLAVLAIITYIGVGKLV